MTPAANEGAKKSLSIVVPVYNEEALITNTVEHLLTTGRQWVNDLEVIVVNDGSSDRTPGIIDQLAEKHDNVRALHQNLNRGFGATVRLGYENSTKSLVMYCPGDHLFTDKEFEIYLMLIKHADIVVGYRRERRSELKLYPWMVSRYYHVLVNALFRFDLYDVNWIHMYHRDQLPQFMGKSDGVFFLAENIVLANRSKKKIIGVDVDYRERQLGMATGAQARTILKTFVELLVFLVKK